MKHMFLPNPLAMFFFFMAKPIQYCKVKIKIKKKKDSQLGILLF